MDKPRTGILLIRSITALALLVPAVWWAWIKSPCPLLLLVGTAAALVSIQIGQQSEARYGRRIIVTEMINVGRKENDRQLIIGGVAGYLMALSYAAAAWFAF